jgi:hypothetical protein
MIKLKSFIKESDIVKIDRSTDSLTGPTVSPEQKMIRIPQLNWYEIIDAIKTEIIKNHKMSDEKAFKMVDGIFAYKAKYLTPSMFDVITKITPLQMETLDYYTDGNATTIIQRAKDLYKDFADTYNQGYGMLKGQQRAKMF